MPNRVLVLTFVVIAAIFLGVTITVEKINSPIMQRLVEQQGEILKLERKLDRQLSGGQADGTEGQKAGAAAATAPSNVETRLSSLEEKLDGLVNIFKQLRGGGGGGAQQPQEPSDEYTKVHTIDIGASPVRGNKDAPVTIVEFVDFQCPFCSRFHPAVDEALAAYPDKVKYVLKHFPLSFHQWAKPASKAVLAAGEQGKYYEMVDLILKDNSDLSDAKFEVLAKQLGLNIRKFKDDLKKNDTAWEKLIDDDFQQGTQVDVRGTPTYYINGKKTMARDINSYKREIDAILQQGG